MSSGGTRDGPSGNDPQEHLERVVAMARGPAGAKGERGERGLSRVQGRAVVVLFFLAVILAVFAIFWVNHAVRSATATQQRQAAAEKAAQQRASAAVEGKLCKSLGPLAGLAGLKPPAGNPGDNPSRAYEQRLSAKLAALAQLGPDLGCKP